MTITKVISTANTAMYPLVQILIEKVKHPFDVQGQFKPAIAMFKSFKHLKDYSIVSTHLLQILCQNHSRPVSV